MRSKYNTEKDKFKRGLMYLKGIRMIERAVQEHSLGESGNEEAWKLQVTITEAEKNISQIYLYITI